MNQTCQPLMKTQPLNWHFGSESPLTPSSGLWPAYHRLVHVYETDMDGVVHFTNYLRIAEEALFAGLRALGCPFEKSGHSIAMLHATAHYVHPLKFGDQIDVVLTDVVVKRVRFGLTFEFRREDLACAMSQLTLVTITPEDRKAIPLPQNIKDILSVALGAA